MNDIDSLKAALRQFAAERDWGQFHSPKNLTMALTVEAAELQEHFQWLTEAQSRELSADKKHAVAHELADVFIYLLQLSNQLDVDLLAVAREKMALNAKKYPADTAKDLTRKPHAS